MSLRPLLISGLLATATAFLPIATNNAIAARSLSPPPPSSSLSMVAVDTSEIKNGLTIEIDGDPYKIMGFSIMKQARGAAKTTIKMKNLRKGNTIENTYRSGEKFETAEITRKPSQFTYEDEVREERDRDREVER
jgi:elongation factor P